MPNHVTNILRVSGDPDKVSAVFEVIKNDEIGLGGIDTSTRLFLCLIISFRGISVWLSV